MADYGGSNRLLKAHEVASILQVSRTQAYKLMASGDLPSVRFGGQTVRVKQGDLDQFICDHSSRQSDQGEESHAVSEEKAK
jgi:excisionase family DNA binding protein